MSYFALKHMCFQRMIGAVLWNMVLQACFLSTFVLMANINLKHPVVWLTSWSTVAFRLSTWLYAIPLCSVVVAQGVICSKDYVSASPLLQTRIAMIRKVLSLQNFIIGTLHVLIGLTIPWIYSSLAGTPYNDFTSKNEFSTCLMEPKLFFIMGGVWISLYYFMLNHFCESRHLSFSFIQLHKLAQVKATLFRTVKISMKNAISPMVIYVIIYYIKGGSVREFVQYTLSLELCNEPMDTFFGLFDLWLLLHLWFFSFIFVASMKLTEFLFKIYLSERHVFPVYDTNEGIILPEGLNKTSIPIIQHLAFLDLYLVSEKSEHRRKQIFTLSQPGGHPHAWNAIKGECFLLITSFNDALQTALKHPSRVVPSNKGPRVPHAFHVSPSLQREAARLHVLQPSTPISPADALQLLADWLESKVKWLKKLPIVVYFFGDIHEAKIEYLLLHSLPVAWATQSLSLLACSSLSEDRYGVMQNDLPKIITTLLDLKQSLDQLQKCGGTFKKSLKQSAVVLKKRNSLRSSVKRSLYRLAITFKRFIADLQLPKDAEQQMLSYIAFKEC